MPRLSDITPRVGILSAASRQAIEAVGGLENAATLATAGKSQLSRCQSSNDGDTLSLRDALEIDEAGLGRGGPHILHTMSLLLRHVAIPMPSAPSDHDEIAAQILIVAQELGDVSREAMEAARDGVWTPEEARRTLAQVKELIGGAGALVSLLTAIAYPAQDAGGQD